MSEGRTSEQRRPASEDAERQRPPRIVDKIERSLASLDAGHGVPHTDVLAMIDRRYPGSN